MFTSTPTETLRTLDCCVEKMNHGTSTVKREKIALKVVNSYDKNPSGWIFHVLEEEKLTVLFTPLENIMKGISSHYLYSV